MNRLVSCLSAAILVTCLLAGSAKADPLGAFTPLGCLEDLVNAPRQCGTGQAVDFLQTPPALDVSPDGRHVYAAVAGRNAGRGGIAILARDTTTGGLTAAGCVEDAETLDDLPCATTAIALGTPSDVAVSPDGRNVYAVTRLGSTLVRLDRDPTTGALTGAQCFEPAVAGTPRCPVANRVAGLVGLAGVVVSPDGTSVFTFAFTGEPGGANGAVARFARDPTTGTLTYQGCLAAMSGTAVCGAGNSVVGIGGARDGAFSPDATSLYVAGVEDEAVTRFTRDTTTGALSAQGCIQFPGASTGCAATTPALVDPESLVVSPDGRNVYVASGTNGDSLTRLDRDTATGAITPAGCFREVGFPGCAAEVSGLGGASSVVVTPDGTRVFVGGRTGGAIVDFVRDPATGALTPDGCEEAPSSNATCGGAPVPGTNGVRGLAITADGRGLVAAGSESNAVAAFGTPAADTPPTAVDDAATVGQDAAATTIDVLANDTDPDGGPRSVTAVTTPAAGTAVVLAGGASVSYRPRAGYCNSQTAGVPDTFRYTVNGGSTAAVAVTVPCASPASTQTGPQGAGGTTTGGLPDPIGTLTTPLVPPAAEPAGPGVALGCTPNTLELTDVLPRNGRTALLGVAPASAVGRRVALVSQADGKTVATAVVRPDLTFAATAPLPPPSIRSTDRARYAARLAGRTSRALKFSRRAYTTSVVASGRTVTFAGTITKPLAKPVAAVRIRVATACSAIGSGRLVATVTPKRSGTFSARFLLPAGQAVAYLRAETSVRRTTTSSKRFRTFTLVRGVRIAGGAT